MRLPDFQGSDYERQHDLVRLTNQLERIKALMSDHQWRTLREIEDVTGDNGASISSQLKNLRKKPQGAYTVEKRIRGDRRDGLWEYRVGERGTHTPVKPAVLLRAEAAERFADDLADALEQHDPSNPLLALWDGHRNR